MNGCKFSFATASPFRAPIIIPTNITIAIAPKVGSLAYLDILYEPVVAACKCS